MASFGFKGCDQQKKVGDLSGGERNRVQLAKVLRSGGNVLLLDEPTNDLDVDTLRALEDALLGFPGCAVVISHDRWFLDRMATHVLAFEGDSEVRWWEGNFTRLRGRPPQAARRRRRPAPPHQVQAPGPGLRFCATENLRHRESAPPTICVTEILRHRESASPRFCAQYLLPDADDRDMDTLTPTSRAVTRRIAPGSGSTCAHCDNPLKFSAKAALAQVIANVYVDGRWERVEHFHAECYETASEPYGKPVAEHRPLTSARGSR